MAPRMLLLALAAAAAACSAAQQTPAAGAALPPAPVAGTPADAAHPCVYTPPPTGCHTDGKGGSVCDTQGSQAKCERPNEKQQYAKCVVVIAGVAAAWATMYNVNQRRRPEGPEQLPLLMPKPGQEGYNPSEPQNMQSHKTYGVSRFCLFPVLWNTRQDQYTTVAYVAFLVTWLTVGYYFMQPCPNGAPFFSFCAGAGSDVYVCAVSPDGTSCLAQY